MTARPRLVLKLGGELLEQPKDLSRMARAIAGLSARADVVVVHGGGREIDAALAAVGIPKHQVDGVRITDERTLDVVVAVLAGTLNTRLVAAVRRAGADPVGLTGADATVATLRRAPPLVSVEGTTVDLGLVGLPSGSSTPRLLTDLLTRRYVPIVACIGATRQGQVLNVNADTLAAHLAVTVGAQRLVMAGGTAGVLDADGRTIGRLTDREAARLVRAGTASRGMVAKLEACRSALRGGVGDVVIADGRKTRLNSLADRKARLTHCTVVM